MASIGRGVRRVNLRNWSFVINFFDIMIDAPSQWSF